LASFLQTLSEVYKPPSNENRLLTLAKQAVFSDSKSVLKEELLKDISHLVVSALDVPRYFHAILTSS
jgi:hypothetical protein